MNNPEKPQFNRDEAGNLVKEGLDINQKEVQENLINSDDGENFDIAKGILEKGVDISSEKLEVRDSSNFIRKISEELEELEKALNISNKALLEKDTELYFKDKLKKGLLTKIDKGRGVNNPMVKAVEANTQNLRMRLNTINNLIDKIKGEKQVLGQTYEDLTKRYSKIKDMLEVEDPKLN
jgi:hypothetical protein